MLVIWVELYRNKLWGTLKHLLAVYLVLHSEVLRATTSLGDRGLEVLRAKNIKIPGYNLTLSSLVSSLIFLWSRRTRFARRPVCGKSSGIGLILELLLSCLRQNWVRMECFESPQLRYTHVEPCKNWKEGNDESDCALYLFTDLELGSCFPHLGSCTCTVDTFMNIICFFLVEVQAFVFWPCYVAKEFMANH